VAKDLHAGVQPYGLCYAKSSRLRPVQELSGTKSRGASGQPLVETSLLTLTSAVGSFSYLGLDSHLVEWMAPGQADGMTGSISENFARAWRAARYRCAVHQRRARTEVEGSGGFAR